METATFVPKLPAKIDRASNHLRRISQVLLLVTLVLMPLFFVPTIPGLALFPKVFLVVFGALISFLFVSLLILRSGSVSLRFTPLILSWWLLVLMGLVSAVLAPNLQNALFGDALEIHTVGFLALLGLVMSLLPLIGNSKKFVLYLYGSLVVSAILAAALFCGRLIFGTQFLSFGLLTTLTDNFVGSFNDLGLFLGCVVMVVLVTVAQLDLPKKGLLFVAVLLGLAIIVLASVNFFLIWLLLALFSLMLLMYVLTKDRFGKPEGSVVHHNLLLGSVMVIGVVFIVSVIFLIGGTALGTAFSKTTGVNYIEIRPSLSATADILRPVYAAQALTGSGPNRFVEVWSLYKDESINGTIFWNTPFTAGGGYIPTWFVTTGLLGLIAWVLFLGAFVYTGVRTLLLNNIKDTFWFFIGTISFVAGLFIWIVALLYVPGPTILLLGAVCTGTLVIAQQKLTQNVSRTYNLLSSSKTGFVLIATVMICVIGILSAGYAATQQLSAAYIFTTATKNLPTDTTAAVQVVSERITEAYNRYPSDTYARSLANYQLSYINSLLSVNEPTPGQQQQFQKAISAALSAGTEAITRKSTDARNWQTLADIYVALALFNIEGAKERAVASYHEAEIRDPKNPLYVLQKAAMEARSGNSAEARRLALLSLNLKPNFTDALYLLSQLDIAAGDIATAITTTESIISIEAGNPGRYYQLGVLYGAIKNTSASIAAFKTAISLNPNYANARYFLAQQYIIDGKVDLAVTELEIVRGLNPDNTIVTDLITKIKSGEINAKTLTEPVQTITEGSEVTTESGVTTSGNVPNSKLLTPVNTVPAKTTTTDTKTPVVVPSTDVPTSQP